MAPSRRASSPAPGAAKGRGLPAAPIRAFRRLLTGRTRAALFVRGGARRFVSRPRRRARRRIARQQPRLGRTHHRHTQSDACLRHHLCHLFLERRHLLLRLGLPFRHQPRLGVAFPCLALRLDPPLLRLV